LLGKQGARKLSRGTTGFLSRHPHYKKSHCEECNDAYPRSENIGFFPHGQKKETKWDRKIMGSSLLGESLKKRERKRTKDSIHHRNPRLVPIAEPCESGKPKTLINQGQRGKSERTENKVP